jgi:hypothetical protein
MAVISLLELKVKPQGSNVRWIHVMQASSESQGSMEDSPRPAGLSSRQVQYPTEQQPNILG